MADTAVLPPATHRQPSRKGKRAWRKNVDLDELQHGLESVRDEVIQGGVIAEKPAEELFLVDAAGDAHVERQQQSKKLLKADEILALRSAVPGLDGRKRKAPEPVLPTSSSSKRPRDGKYVSHRELQRLKRLADNADGGAAVDEAGAAYDPWIPAPPPKHAELDFVSQPQPVREPDTLRQAPVPLTANGRPTPAVRKPEAGKSYNPLVGDWTALLEREGEAAVEAEKARLLAEAAAADKEARALAEAARVEAAERDDWATDYESEWDGIQSDTEGQNHTSRMQRRKTPAERNKVKARKEREAREKWERKQKVRDVQERRIQQIAKEMSARDKAARPRALMAAGENDASDSDAEGELQLRRRKFGQLPVPQGPLEVVLPDELQDSLRRLKPEGNLLTDRYRTLLINGKMEVRKRRGQHKQRKTDRTEKWSYKDWRLR